jgi:hypothetical protein
MSATFEIASGRPVKRQKTTEYSDEAIAEPKRREEEIQRKEEELSKGEARVRQTEEDVARIENLQAAYIRQFVHNEFFIANLELHALETRDECRAAFDENLPVPQNEAGELLLRLEEGLEASRNSLEEARERVCPYKSPKTKEALKA